MRRGLPEEPQRKDFGVLRLDGEDADDRAEVRLVDCRGVSQDFVRASGLVDQCAEPGDLRLLHRVSTPSEVATSSLVDQVDLPERMQEHGGRVRAFGERQVLVVDDEELHETHVQFQDCHELAGEGELDFDVC